MKIQSGYDSFNTMLIFSHKIKQNLHPDSLSTSCQSSSCVAPHERLSELPVVPREKSDTCAAAGENQRLLSVTF